MNNHSTSGNSRGTTTPAGLAAPALLPAKASKRLSLISAWLSTLKQLSNVAALCLKTDDAYRQRSMQLRNIVVRIKTFPWSRGLTQSWVATYETP